VVGVDFFFVEVGLQQIAGCFVIGVDFFFLACCWIGLQVVL